MKTLIAIFALTAAAPVFATGFTSNDIASAAQSVDDHQAQLGEETEILRLGIAFDVSQGIAARSEGEQAALLGALPTGEGKGDLLVKWFMAGAIAQPSHNATTLLYHPLARATLALDWVKGESGWRVKNAWLSSSGPAQWPASGDPWRKAFAEDYRSARAALGDAGASWFAFESDRWLGGLANWLRVPAQAQATTRAGKLIADGRAANANGGNIDLIAEQVRATYAPIAAIPRKDGGQAVVFGSAMLPGLLIAADFGGGAALEKLSLINLGNVGDGK